MQPGIASKSRQTIWAGSIMGAKIRAEGARKRAAEAIREADRAEAEHGRSRWKATAAPRSVSLNASMAGSAGLRWNVSDARHAQAYRSMPSDARAVCRFGNWTRRWLRVWIGARKRTKRKQAQAGSCKLNPRLVSPLRTSKLPTWRRNDFALLVGRSQLRNAPVLRPVQVTAVSRFFFSEN